MHNFYISAVTVLWFISFHLFYSLRCDEFRFGCTSLRVPPDLLYQLRNDITISPNGVAFVKVVLRICWLLISFI